MPSTPFLSLPAIVSWHERHFVVVEIITRRHVILIDPAFGRRRITRGLFDRFCSGVAVTFADASREEDARLFERRLLRQAFATARRDG